MSRVRVLVVGGGIAGMSAAISACQSGCEVDLVEKYSTDATLGIGIALPGNALRALDQLGVLDACIAAGAAFDGWLFTDAQGDNRRHIPGVKTAGPDRPAMIGITRPDYIGILSKAASNCGARLRYGTTVASLSQNAAGVEVAFSDGTDRRYDVVIAADGIRSQVRELLFGKQGRSVQSGQAVWRVYMPRLPEVNDLWLCDGGEGGKAGFCPLRQDLMYLYLTDTSTTKPPEDDLPQILFEKLNVFGGLIGHCRDRYVRDGRPVIWNSFELVDLPAPWYQDRVIIIGDGAHATTAHLGQGGAMALEDGVVIGQELGRAATIGAAFDGFMARRYGRINNIQTWSHQICRWEMERTPGADYVGLTAKAFELVQEPI
ncbi:FAD-binding protein [Xanthomonas hyacinthi]|uniref:FAD-binding domain-containing protein n=1 Tax=Xanthomonas hyacinthi TaxID=56455 RepID=A0A2S7F1W9_9XANT|nr:FAD-dependent monooxygenase [Xanthomonas hyacinthi]KLD79013.1 hypothetical protein Y886_06985 [Xanthomonas hyacinthi DSM 19077]PPU99373.1 hypothetical protein XhyaCFBP1156_03655 [Xanthomonas hyacinthi]QGY78366.1 FAD-binding protein [Xanthomonas hyacinthi]